MSFYYYMGSLGLLIPIVICVAVVVCCVALCCLCCKKRNRQRHQNVTTVIYTHPSPQQQQQPIPGYQPSYPAYQPVPLHTGGGFPDALAPPPTYLEATNPALYPNHPGPPMFLHSSQPSGHSDVNPQLPYNPDFCPGIAS